MKHKDVVLSAITRGLYSCNQEGQIFSHVRSVNDKHGVPVNRLLKKRIMNSGYCQNLLVIDDKKYFILSHQLVFLFFNRNECFENKVINHIDGVKSNNKISNIELVTVKENVRHAIDVIKTNKVPGGGDKSRNKKLTQDMVNHIRANFGLVSDEYLAIHHSVSSRTIKDVGTYRTWKN